MSKFKVGDEVVCIDASGSDLDMLQHYIVTEVDEEHGDVAFNNVKWFYFGSRFELAPEWASHQKPVNTETELALTKLQVKMLQDLKKDALYLLNCVEDEGSSPCFKDMVKYFLDNNKLKGFYD